VRFGQGFMTALLNFRHADVSDGEHEDGQSEQRPKECPVLGLKPSSSFVGCRGPHELAA
jgi:hypothetical protein